MPCGGPRLSLQFYGELYMYQLASRIVADLAEGLVVRTFSGNVCAKLRFVAERALVRRGVAKSLGYFTIV